jgi:type I restriction enzyme S subunit
VSEMAAPAVTRYGEGPLPIGWTWATLGDVCDFLDSRRVPVNDTERVRRIAGKAPDELFPYYGANGQVGWIDGYLFEEPLILLAEDGGNFGSTTRSIAYAVQGRYWVNNHAHVLRPKPGVDYHYLLHALQIRPDVGRLVSGSTRGKLNQEIASAIPVPLAPPVEQERIAQRVIERLAAVERARAAAEAQLAAATKLAAAHLRALFSDIKAWPSRVLGEIGELLPARSISTNADAEVLAVTTACLTETGFDLRGMKTACMRSADVPQCTLRPGEILVARSNTPDLVGRVAVFPGTAQPAVASDLTIRLWCNDPALPQFVSAYLSYLYLSGYWKERAGGASGTMKKITRPQILGLEVPLPALEEQRMISEALARKMGAILKFRSELRSQAESVEQLPAALLRAAFAGEL